MHDFRRIPGDPLAEGSRQFRLGIRAAIARREIALDLAKEIGEPAPAFPITLSLDDAPVDSAHRLRKAIGVGLSERLTTACRPTAHRAAGDAGAVRVRHLRPGKACQSLIPSTI